MDHIAIMRKSWGLIPKILNGEKTIESRWYKARYMPWNRIEKGGTVYFKNSGEPVTVKATVSKVVQIGNLNEPKILKILNKNRKKLGIENISWFYEKVKNKNYCILIFLKGACEVKPFEINKSGFGTMSAWIIANNINAVKIRKE